MRKILYASILTSILYLTGRFILVSLRDVESPYWGITMIPVIIFVLAMMEITWSRWRFRELEPVIRSLIVGRRNTAVGRWYRMCVRRMYDPRLCVATSLAFLPLCTYLIIWHVRWSFWISDSLVGWYDRLWIILAMAAAASSQWPFANISLFIARLPEKKLTINFYAHRDASIMAFGSFMLKIDLGGVALTFLAGVGLYAAPTASSPLVYALLLIVFIWAIVWFFLTQYNVHRCMVLEKREMLDPIAARLMTSLVNSLENPTDENLKAHNVARDVYEKIELLPEWPFNLRNVLALVSGLILPITLSAQLPGRWARCRQSA